ncbi:CRAL/TRIO domain-containing protein [Colletotrichum tofieldiae]|nr:CRAL/TRIO domain-containing protein [Colletotrichum tofieldiae]
MASVADQTPASAGLPEKAAAPAPGPLKTPIATPTPASSIPAVTALTPDQQSKYDSLLAQARSWTEVKCAAAHADKSGPLTDSERQWLTRECLLRYLRATKWSPKDAEKRLLETLVWRREYGVEALTPEHISPENETGKQIILGFDKERRPCHYLNPGRQNTDPSPRQVQHLVFMLERVIELMPAGQEKIALLINFKTSKSRSNTAPGIGLAREVLHILQTHYPERLGKALIINGM